MRSKNIQSDGVGNGAESDFINRVLDRLHKELQFFSTDSVTVEQTTRGTRFYAKIPPATTATPVASSGGWNWLGLYNPVTTYAQNDVVQLGSGTAAGMYLSIINTNTNSPDSGIGWVQISTSAGTWL